MSVRLGIGIDCELRIVGCESRVANRGDWGSVLHSEVRGAENVIGDGVRGVWHPREHALITRTPYLFLFLLPSIVTGRILNLTEGLDVQLVFRAKRIFFQKD